MKKIIIAKENEGKITEAIKSAEGRAAARTINYSDVEQACINYFNKLGISKKDADGIKIAVDANAQGFPSAYKYTPESTHFDAEYHAGKWYLTSVSRSTCTKVQYKAMLTDAAKDALVHKYAVIK